MKVQVGKVCRTMPILDDEKKAIRIVASAKSEPLSFQRGHTYESGQEVDI